MHVSPWGRASRLGHRLDAHGQVAHARLPANRIREVENRAQPVGVGPRQERIVLASRTAVAVRDGNGAPPEVRIIAGDRPPRPVRRRDLHEIACQKTEPTEVVRMHATCHPGPWPAVSPLTPREETITEGDTDVRQLPSGALAVVATPGDGAAGLSDLGLPAGSSQEQRDAERVMLDLLSFQLGLELDPDRRQCAWRGHGEGSALRGETGSWAFSRVTPPGWRRPLLSRTMRCPVRASGRGC
jgi:hypothetical protein